MGVFYKIGSRGGYLSKKKKGSKGEFFLKIDSKREFFSKI